MQIDFSGNDMPRKKHPELGPEFDARFESECEACGGLIQTGDPARYFQDVVMHSTCAEQDAE